MINKTHTRNMVESYENSFGTEALLKICISNIHKILVEKGVITEQKLVDRIRMEITSDIAKIAKP